MATPITDQQQHLLGYTSYDEIADKEWLYDSHMNLLGHYSGHSNQSFDSHGHCLGNGNQIMRLLYT